MCKVLWDRWGILFINFLTRGETVNAEHYCKILQKLRQTIQNKRCRLLSAGVVLLHNNTWPHTARWSTHLLQDFSWEVFNHPPYSPDPVPSNFHLFLYFKKFLSGQLQDFQNDRVGDECHTGFQSQAANFYDTGIQLLVPRYDKCLISGVELKNSSTFAVSISIILSINLGFFSVNGLRETYFVDILHTSYLYILSVLWISYTQ